MRYNDKTLCSAQTDSGRCRDIAIYGAGGLGRELAAMIHNINKEKPTWNLIGFFDDGRERGASVSHYGEVLGGAKEVNTWQQTLGVVIAVGSPTARRAIREGIKNTRICFPNLVYPDFAVSDPETFSIGEGNVITTHCTATVNVSIGNFNLLNGSVVFGHDDVVGDYNVFMPDSRISGEVKIGNGNLFGAGSIVIQRTRVGSGISLGAGSVLMTRPRDGKTYIGVPAKKFEF